MRDRNGTQRAETLPLETVSWGGRGVHRTINQRLSARWRDREFFERQISSHEAKVPLRKRLPRKEEGKMVDPRASAPLSPSDRFFLYLTLLLLFLSFLLFLLFLLLLYPPTRWLP